MKASTTFFSRSWLVEKAARSLRAGITSGMGTIGICAAFFFTPFIVRAGPLSSAEQILVELPTEGALVTESQVSRYKDLLPAELVSLVRSGSLDLTVKKSFPEVYASGNWLQNSEALASGESLTQVENQAEMLRGIVRRSSMPFGAGTAFMRNATSASSGNAALWNLQSVWWLQKIVAFDFTLSVFTDTERTQLYTGDFLRIYPAVMGEDPRAQLFRERLRFDLGVGYRPLAYFSFRSLAPEEDFVWTYSAAIGKGRQVTGSNRGDSLLRSSLSLDDMLGWSGKVDLLKITGAGRETLLVPQSPLTQPMTALGQSCFEFVEPITPTLRKTPNLSNATALGRIPDEYAFVPREVFRVEVDNHDPFSVTGRQIFYVDLRTMLLAYRVVYNRSGEPWKLIVPFYEKGAPSSENRHVPILRSLLVFDLILEQRSVIEVKRWTVCETETERFSVKSLDPTPARATPLAAPAPTATRQHQSARQKKLVETSIRLSEPE